MSYLDLRNNRALSREDVDLLLSPAQDYDFLHERMASIVKEFRNPDPTMNHNDFIFSRKKSAVVYRELLRDMDEFLRSGRGAGLVLQQKE